jgi:hypothetical protein
MARPQLAGNLPQARLMDKADVGMPSNGLQPNQRWLLSAPRSRPRKASRFSKATMQQPIRPIDYAFAAAFGITLGCLIAAFI